VTATDKGDKGIMRNYMRASSTPRAFDLGPTIRKEGVQFKVWAPKASSVSLRIIGKTADIAMEPEETGYFSVFVKDLLPGARYFYLLDGEKQRPDPASRFQPEGVHGPSEVIDPAAFSWEDRDWRGMPLEEMILYEIHTGTFTAEGTFEAIISRLDYLNDELGITAIELMPLAQFPGERNWGYDGAYLFAPQNSYGGPQGLKQLVNACHKRGVAVVLDVVYNHLGPEGNYLGDYGFYFTDRYRTPWGPAVNYDGAESDEVRKFIVGNALYWVTEYHIDGLRLDAIHGIFDFSAKHILADIREAVHQQAKRLNRQTLVIAESDLNDVRVIDPPSRGGYGLDAQWNDDFHHCLHTLLTEERNGYYQDFGDLDQLVRAFKEGYVYSGQYSIYRKRRHGSSSKHLPPKKFIVFSQNHDQVGNRLNGDRLTTLVSREALKLAAGLVLLSPNIPLLFMGEEYGEEAPFQYFVSHSDQALIEAVRKGRSKEFAHFQWTGKIPDPQDEATFMRSKIHLTLRHDGEHGCLFNLYRRLITLRKECLPLHPSEKRVSQIRGFKKEKAILIKREVKGEHMLIIFNLNDKDIALKIALEKGEWQQILDSSSTEWGGTGGPSPTSIHSDGSNIVLALAPHSFILYRQSSEKVLKSFS
jgi:maltooligosyltrehalose trehalohydrolase